MMPLPGVQIYLWPSVTLTLDLLIPKVDRFMPLPVDKFTLLQQTND